jgi:uncharacterized membrane protein
MRRNFHPVEPVDNHQSYFQKDVFNDKKFIGYLTAFKNACRELKYLKRSDLDARVIDLCIAITLIVVGVAVVFFGLLNYHGIKCLTLYFGGIGIMLASVLVVNDDRYYIPFRHRLADAIL